MIVLDTNVISELLRLRPDARVLSWLDSLAAADVSTTAVTAAELLYGVARLPDGRRKVVLADEVRAVLESDLGNRVHAFDAPAATLYATLVTERERAGRPIAVADAQIAAICRVFRATLATRDAADFDGTGIDVLDPWRQQ
ncbi:type II toxin-antitoxin system VapC family toxin [soil metagenome]